MFNYLYPIIIIGLFIFFKSFFTVKQQSAAILERFGKFHRICQSGLHLKIPLVDKISGKLSL
ncbi:SPFH domain-containing protein, partial [Tenacibaculum finnmarkense]